MADVDFAFLCAAATFRDGLLSVLDAGIDEVLVREFPSQVSLSVVFAVRADPLEQGTRHLIGVDLRRASNDERLGYADLPFEFLQRPDDELFRPSFTLHQTIPFAATGPDSYEFRFQLDGSTLVTRVLRVDSELPTT